MSSIEQQVSELLGITDFKKQCIECINEIWKDKKIDMQDIPYIVSLITLIYYKNPLKNIKRENIKEVFKALIIKLLDELKIYDLLNANEKQLLSLLLDTSFNMLLLNISDLSKSCLSCCSKKLKCEDMISNIEETIKKVKEVKDITLNV